MANKKGASKSKVGAGLAAGAAAALAGYYFYAAPNAKKHRKVAARWATALKKDVVTEVKKLKKIDQVSIQRAVDKVAKFYHESGDARRKDVIKAAHELKRHWSSLQKEIGGRVRDAAKTVKKTARKVSKK